MTSHSESVDAIRERLRAVGQEHLLTFWNELEDAPRAELLRQIATLDLEDMPGLVERYVLHDTPFELPADIRPAPYYAAHGDWNRDRYAAAGEDILRAGQVACFVVAGGQGSRLGYDGPKGCYPTGCVSGKSLFQIFSEKILAASRRYGVAIPFYIMTSPLNHEQTITFFRDHGCFGLSESDVIFFQQGVMPSIDKASGRILLAAKDRVATNPDGHGGAYKALVTGGAVDDMRRRGVRHVSYFQVDNPNIQIIDPVFIGLHASAGGSDGPASSGEISSKMLPKAEPKEKVGLFVHATVDGRADRTAVIEYSDLPDELAEERTAQGDLRYNAGSIAIHCMSVDFVERIATDPSSALPFHRAVKKVPHVDLESGEPVEPEEPNAVKLERFVFDAIPLAEHSIVMETDRVEEFAPVKNREGVDSIVTSRRLQTEKAARWLEAAGVKVPRTPSGAADCTIELSPLTALFRHDLAGRTDLPQAVEPGSSITL